MFKTKRGSKKEELKTVRVVTKEREHVCTDDCFKERKKQRPRGLKRVELGHIHRDVEGRYFSEWGDGDWLEVTGIQFVEGPGGMHLMFLPKEELHIHSRGGRTVARVTTQHDDPGNEDYHARAAATHLKKKNRNLKETREYLGAKAAEVVTRAPRTKKRTSGRGRGGPGVPRSDRGRKIMSLIEAGKSKPDVLFETIDWAKRRGENIAGPFKKVIKNHVDRLWPKKSPHK